MDFIGTSLANPWANTILPFLGWVLFLSFIKQIFNYIFVANDQQNKLLGINLFGVIFGLSAWLYLIPKFQIAWWIITQSLLEILFVSWSIFIAYRSKLIPKIDRKKMLTLLGISTIALWIWYYFIHIEYTKFFHFAFAAAAVNIPLILLSIPTIKKVAVWLTHRN
jgi:O-antigen/teichoic acid export membrane protein